jgi:Uma2 family endonuclease
MSVAAVQRYFTLAEYLAREAAATFKSEFYRGEIFAMAGGTPEHNIVAVNVLGSLWGMLAGKSCRPFNSDQQIRIRANGLITYPDISIVCGDLQRDPDSSNAINNPSVIVEVLSDSTESYDRGKKFGLYRQLESLREYILIAQDEAHVERYVRQADDTWVLTIYSGLDAQLEVATVNCSLPLNEIYSGVTFPPPKPHPDFAVRS